MIWIASFLGGGFVLSVASAFWLSQKIVRATEERMDPYSGRY